MFLAFKLINLQYILSCTFHYIALTDFFKASRSQLFSTCYVYTSMTFDNITSFLSYETSFSQTISFQFDINTFNNNI